MLTPEERQGVIRLLVQFGRDVQSVADDLNAIEYSVLHYWHVWRLMPGDEERRKPNKAARAASTKPLRRPPSPGRTREAELRWLLTGLAAMWARRFGKPFEPRKTNRDNLWDFVEPIVKIADPYVTPANISSILRKVRLFEFWKRQGKETASRIGGKT